MFLFCLFAPSRRPPRHPCFPLPFSVKTTILESTWLEPAMGRTFLRFFHSSFCFASLSPKLHHWRPFSYLRFERFGVASHRSRCRTLRLINCSGIIFLIEDDLCVKRFFFSRFLLPKLWHWTESSRPSNHIANPFFSAMRTCEPSDSIFPPALSSPTCSFPHLMAVISLLFSLLITSHSGRNPRKVSSPPCPIRLPPGDGS